MTQADVLECSERNDCWLPQAVSEDSDPPDSRNKHIDHDRHGCDALADSAVPYRSGVDFYVDS